jgi:hypothetical protein
MRGLACIAITLLLVVILPATAMGASVTRDDNGIITIVQNVAGSDDEITISVSGDQHVIRDPGGVIESSADCTQTAFGEVSCDAGTSIAATLEDGNDTFIDNGVPVPVAVDLGDGTDTFTG